MTIQLNPIGSGYNTSAINDNFSKIENELNSNVLHIKDGLNYLDQQIDANSNRIINLPAPVNDTEPLRLIDARAVVGLPGPEGAQGEQGIEGPQGIPGIQGAQGNPGFQGHNGLTGRQGAAGVAGPQGQLGNQGLTGPQGSVGIQGEQGVQGEEGSNFDPDATIYLISDLSNYDSEPKGFTVLYWEIGTGPSGSDVGHLYQRKSSTPGDWAGPIEFGRGPQGPQGVPGVQGLPGVQGIPGPEGPQGPEGEEGPKGATGEQGQRGDQGVPGVRGDQGLQGIPGQQGPQGITGPAGPQGQQGPMGPTGPKGPEGAKGPVGNQGLPGRDGARGPDGRPGSDGADGRSSGAVLPNLQYHSGESASEREYLLANLDIKVARPFQRAIELTGYVIDGGDSLAYTASYKMKLRFKITAAGGQTNVTDGPTVTVPLVGQVYGNEGLSTTYVYGSAEAAALALIPANIVGSIQIFAVVTASGRRCKWKTNSVYGGKSVVNVHASYTDIM